MQTPHNLFMRGFCCHGHDRLYVFVGRQDMRAAECEPNLFSYNAAMGACQAGHRGWVVIFGAFFSGANFWCLSIKRVILEKMKWWRIKHVGQIVGRERCDTTSHLFSRARRNKENNMFTLVCLKMRVLPVCPQTLFLIETSMMNLPAYDEDFHHHCIVVEVPKLPNKWFRGMTLLASSG